MNKNLDKIAKELFGKIRSQFSDIILGNESAEIIDVPHEARFFEFNFKKNGLSLGSVTINLLDGNTDDNEEDNIDSLVIMYSNDIIKDQPTGIKRHWFNFLKELREFAKQRLLNFEARDILKSLDKKDYDFLSKKRGDKHMAESKLWGTNKTSYQNMGESRIIVKHYKPINGEIPTGRSHSIESIYIENTQGERFKYPYKHLSGARAMARHVANGGNPYDSIGEHVIGLSEELSKLRMFKGYVSRNPMVSEAMDSVQTKVMERINDIKKQIHQLQGQQYYSTFSESFSKNEYQEIPEEIMNDWVEKLTIRSFNEELKSVFPYIYNIMNETQIKELTADDLIEYNEEDDQEEINESTGIVESELVEYESYIDSLLEDTDLLSNPETQKQAIEQLNQLLSQPLEVGADGTNAIESISSIISDQQLFDVFKELSDISPESDVREIIKDYIKIYDEDHGTNIFSQLSSEGSTEPSVEPVAEPSAAPSAEGQQPVADSVIHPIYNTINKAVTAGMTLEDTFTIGKKSVRLKDAIEMAGFKVEDFFKDNSNKDQEEIVEFVTSLYDRHTGTFPVGETGALLKVEKQFGKPATKVAAEAIKSLRHQFESTRIKKLAGL
jgi:hypothetical protein